MRKKLDNNQIKINYERAMKKHRNLYTTLDNKIVTKKQINDNYFFNYIQNRQISNIETTFPIIDEEIFFN